MQYSVPQFIEIEDKIIGPLTLKQFLILLSGGLVAFLYWSIFKTGAIFFLLTLPTMGGAAFVAFGRFNGRPLLASTPNLIKFFLASKERVFKREAESALLVKKQETKMPPRAQEELAAQEKLSRLKRLAYLLDQKTAEEERLIHSGQMPQTWLNQI